MCVRWLSGDGTGPLRQGEDGRVGEGGNRSKLGARRARGRWLRVAGLRCMTRRSPGLWCSILDVAHGGHASQLDTA